MITDAKAALDEALAGREPDDDTMPRYGMVRLKHLTALREQLAHLEYAERVLNEGLLAAYRNNASAYTERNAALGELAALRAQPAPGVEVTEAMVEKAAARASREWDMLDESLPERDENHENHVEAAERWLNARTAHHLTAALRGAK